MEFPGGHFGAFWGHLEALWGHFGALWGHLGVTLDHFETLWAHFGVTFGCMRVALVPLSPFSENIHFPMNFNDFTYLLAHLDTTWGILG